MPGFDQLVQRVLGREKPQPEGFPLNPPSRLVRVQHSLPLNVLQDPVIPRSQDIAHVVPRLVKAAFRHRELPVVVVGIQNLAQHRPLQVMHQPRQADGPVQEKIGGNLTDSTGRP